MRETAAMETTMRQTTALHVGPDGRDELRRAVAAVRSTGLTPDQARAEIRRRQTSGGTVSEDLRLAASLNTKPTPTRRGLDSIIEARRRGITCRRCGDFALRQAAPAPDRPAALAYYCARCKPYR